MSYFAVCVPSASFTIGANCLWKKELWQLCGLEKDQTDQNPVGSQSSLSFAVICPSMSFVSWSDVSFTHHRLVIVLHQTSLCIRCLYVSRHSLFLSPRCKNLRRSLAHTFQAAPTARPNRFPAATNCLVMLHCCPYRRCGEHLHKNTTSANHVPQTGGISKTLWQELQS